MINYYENQLSALKLKRCYDIAAEPVKIYLESEIEYVRKKINKNDRILELGCGYGRVLRKLISNNIKLYGIDIAIDNLTFAREYLNNLNSYFLFQMDALNLGFRKQQFNVVFCIQNGISAFNVNQTRLISEAVRVTKPGGLVLFSSYSDKFWEKRLEWFRIQSDEGLIGEIDYNRTGDGDIVCKDGFRATAVRPDDFRELTNSLDCSIVIEEIAGSSIFCEIKV